MAINISISKTLVFMIQSKIIHFTVFSIKRISIIEYLDVLAFTKMRTDKNKF